MKRLSRAACWPSPWPLLLGLCFATWLIGLALALPYGVETATQHWKGQLNDHIVIALPTTENSDNASQIKALPQALASTFPGTGVTRLPDHDVAQILANWSAPWNGPLPTLITLYYRGDVSALTGFVHKYSPDAIIIPPPPQQAKLAPLMTSLHEAARHGAFAAGFAAALLIPALLYLGARTTALANANQQALLPQLGGRPSSLHHILARRMALIAFLGSLAGLVLLLPALALLVSTLRPLLRLPPFTGLSSAFIPDLFLPRPFLGMIGLLPFLIAVLSWGMVHLVCSLQGRKTS